MASALEDIGLGVERATPPRSSAHARGARAPPRIEGPFAGRRRASVDIDGDWEMEDDEKVVTHAPALPKAPWYQGCTMSERREFMRRYDAYFRQCRLLRTGASSAFILPVSACIEDRTRQEIVRFEMAKDMADVTEQDWFDYFRQAEECDTEDLEPLERALKTLRMDTKPRDAASRMAKLRRDMMTVLDDHHMVWVLDEEPKLIVKHLTNALAPSLFRDKITERLQLTRYKHHQKDVVGFCR
jgi:hypothetical protein